MKRQANTQEESLLQNKGHVHGPHVSMVSQVDTSRQVHQDERTNCAQFFIRQLYLSKVVKQSLGTRLHSILCLSHGSALRQSDCAHSFRRLAPGGYWGAPWETVRSRPLHGSSLTARQHQGQNRTGQDPDLPFLNPTRSIGTRPTENKGNTVSPPLPALPPPRTTPQHILITRSGEEPDRSLELKELRV